MGIVHKATLSPSKQELVEAWLPSRPWAEGRTIAVPTLKSGGEPAGGSVETCLAVFDTRGDRQSVRHDQ